VITLARVARVVGVTLATNLASDTTMYLPPNLSDFTPGARPYTGDAPTPLPTFRAGVSAFNPWWIVLAIVLGVVLTKRR
jgi:hypothetical protein